MYQVGDAIEQIFTVRERTASAPGLGEGNFFVCQTTLAPGNRWSMHCPEREDIKLGDRFTIKFSVVGVKPDIAGNPCGRVECVFKDYSGASHWISFEAENKPVVVELKEGI